MVRLNRTRADYLDRFRDLIDEYNNGGRNIEEIFRELARCRACSPRSRAGTCGSI
jgi:type I restriction enzyme R subunit